MRVRASALVKPQGILKLLQVALGLTCVCVWRYGANTHPIALDTLDKIHMIIATFTSFLMISVALLICHLFDEEPYACSIECILNPVGGIMYIASGSIFLDFYSSSHPTLNPSISYLYFTGQEIPFSEMRTNGIAVGVLALINGIFYLLDSLVAFMNRGSSIND